MATSAHILMLSAWFLGGFVNGISGMGAALVALPIVATVLPMSTVIPACSLATLTVTLCLALMFGRHCRWASAARLMAASIPGAVMGIWILRTVSGAKLLAAVGVILTIYTLWQWLHKPAPPRQESWCATIAAGFAAGCAHAATTFGGPPVGIYAVAVGWPTKIALGTMGVFFLGTSLVSCGLLAVTDMLTPPVLEFGLWGSAGSILGMLAAWPLTKKINAALFRAILLAVIAAAGVMCLVRAAPALFQ